MQTKIARAMFQVYEPIVLTGYGAPEVQAICDQLGLSEHRMSYYAVRSAALGPVAAEVVSATFYHHPVEMVVMTMLALVVLRIATVLQIIR